MVQRTDGLRRRHRTERPAVAQREGAPVHASRAPGMRRRPLVLGVAFASVLAGASTAAASDWFEVFQSRNDPATASAPASAALAALHDYGDVVVTGDIGVRDVPDANVAAAETGLEAPVVASLPPGVTGEPVYKVGNEVSVTFTFSTERARLAAHESGSELPPPPAGLDGAHVRVEAGPGIAAVWSQPRGMPRLVVARAVAPTASSSGVSFEAMSDYLRSMPGLPGDAVAQLEAFAGGAMAQPLPVPAGQITTSTTEVSGVPATVLVASDQSFAAVAWVIDGTASVVAGSLDADEILSVARNLR